MGEQVSLDEVVQASKVNGDTSDGGDTGAWRASDGRVPGRRGRATRRRLLDQTAAMLRERSYRDVTVIEIARAAGTSPATFYQYFADVEAAVLCWPTAWWPTPRRWPRRWARPGPGGPTTRRRSTSSTPSWPSGTGTGPCCGWSSWPPPRATTGSVGPGPGCSTGWRP